MMNKLQEAFTALSTLPVERQAELAEVLVGVAKTSTRYTDEQLTGIDVALADAETGNFVSEQEIAAVFAKFAG